MNRGVRGSLEENPNEDGSLNIWISTMEKHRLTFLNRQKSLIER